MLLILPLFIILGIVAIILTTIHLSKKKKSCSCLGLPCGTKNSCGTQCCDPLKNEKCVNGICCSTDCTGLSCDQKNGCGEECSLYQCPPGSSCMSGNCCTPQCSSPCSLDGCGGTCPCANSGDICHEGKCCSPHVCESGICGYEKCGQICRCNDNYCSDGGCCKNGQCEYEDICENEKKNFGGFLSSTWARFCQPSINNSLLPQCSGCKLILPQFQKSGDSMSAAPIKGMIQCDTCEVGQGQSPNHNVTPVEIDENVQYYYNKNGELARGPLGKDYCKNMGCGNCTCHNDADCQRWGCSKCVGEKCT